VRYLGWPDLFIQSEELEFEQSPSWNLSSHLPEITKPEASHVQRAFDSALKKES
jgi:hypothetical protein